MKFAQNIIFVFVIVAVLTGCDGYFRVSGTVYHRENNETRPLDSATVKVYCGSDWLRGTTTTDSAGKFDVGGLTTPAKATYYIMFERPGFKTDTVSVSGSRGKTIIDYDQIMSSE